jgi:hypothetical protein
VDSSRTPLTAGDLYVGWGRRSITPDRPVRLQGQFYQRISKYVQSEIVVTVLAVETKDEEGHSLEQMMIGACDLCSIPAQVQAEVRERIKDRLPDFSTDKLFLNATHTHTAPIKTQGEVTAGRYIYQYIPEKMHPVPESVDDEVMSPQQYSEFLVERLCEAFVEAWEKRAPGFAAWQLGHAVVGYNRRVVYDDGSAQMYGSSDTINFDCIEGVSDPGVELLYFWDKNDRFTGVVANVACPSQVVEGHSFISADFWGEVRKQVTEHFPAPLHVLPMCGAAGDQSPRDMIRRGRGEPSMRDVEGAVEMGSRITAAIVSKYEAALAQKRSKLEFGHLVVNVDLPIRTVTRAEYEKAQAEFQAFLAGKNPNEPLQVRDIVKLFPAGGIMARYEMQQTTSLYSPEIHVIRLGDIAIASNPFELFLNYGLRMKARSRAAQTFVVQLACDKGRYLPTEKAVAGGGYSAIVASNLVGPEGGRILVEQTVRLINSMF